MGIVQVAGGGGGGLLQVTASNVYASNSGPIRCGNPGNTTVPGTVVSGGSGNYSFLWTRVGNAAPRGAYIVSNSTTQNPYWTSPGPVCDGDLVTSETWAVSVTDNSTGQSSSSQIVVSIEWVDTSIVQP